MFINLEVLSIEAETDIPRNETSSENPPARQSIVCSVEPAENEYLALETGEIFQALGYARLRGNEDKLIAATLNIHGFADPGEHESALRYWKATGTDWEAEPSGISFQFCVPISDFESLLGNLRAGIHPKSVGVELDDGALGENSKLSYGWEPDGSGMKWNNLDDSSIIPIRRISLKYQIQARTEMKDSESLTAIDFGNAREVNEAVIKRLDTLLMRLIDSHG